MWGYPKDCKNVFGSKLLERCKSNETLNAPESMATRSEGTRLASAINLIIRQKEPNSLETPVDRVDSFLTPTELFYVRSHSPAPKLELASYRLQIDGAVRTAGATRAGRNEAEVRDLPADGL